MKPILCFASILALAVTAQIASAVVIDDFSQGALFIQATNNSGQTVYQNGLDTSDVIGGSRSVYAGSVGGSTTAEIDTSAGQFLLTTDSSAFGYFSLEYGATTPLGANLTADGSDRFLINISESTLRFSRAAVSFGVETGGTWYYYNFANDLIALNGPGILTIPFSDFTGANMTNIRAINIESSRFEPGNQIEIASIMTPYQSLPRWLFS